MSCEFHHQARNAKQVETVETPHSHLKIQDVPPSPATCFEIHAFAEMGFCFALYRVGAFAHAESTLRKVASTCVARAVGRAWNVIWQL